MTNKQMLVADSLADKIILITGGATGLGRSMGEGFLRLGARLVIVSRKADVLEQAAAEMEAETGGQVLALPCDVRDYEAVEAVLEAVKAKWGRYPDGLVNNAAGNFISPTEKLSHRAFDTVVDIVLKGSYNCTLAAGKRWIAAKQTATVLNIVTTYAETGSGFVVPSACAKAGVLAMTRSLAVEWAGYGIRTNAIAPGPFPTEGAWERLFPADALSPELAAKLNPAARVPLGRVGKHEELVNLASYLMSDFSGFINGEVVVIDGGEWLAGAGEFNGLRAIPDDVWGAIARATRKG